ncbi:MAG: hypothetical protein JNL90_05835 [Planctomycetes bacterium]|nr:hypothetical protein [Planctomycetota bacterium]
MATSPRDDPTAGTPSSESRDARARLLIAAIGGGAIGAVLGGLLVATQRSAEAISVGWNGAQSSAALLIAGAGALVGGFVGAMVTRTAVQGLRARFAARRSSLRPAPTRSLPEMTVAPLSSQLAPGTSAPAPAGRGG